MRFTVVLLALFSASSVGAATADFEALNPRGQIHIPIGLANSVDQLKTFVEAEGSFSPGFGSCGIYFWLRDTAASALTAPTMNGVPCEHSLGENGLLIPRSTWRAGDFSVQTELCQVEVSSPAGPAQLVAARVHVKFDPTKARSRQAVLYAALRPLGPAGGPLYRIAVEDGLEGTTPLAGTALLVEDRPALICMVRRGVRGGVSARDDLGEQALKGRVPNDTRASSSNGTCSGVLAWDHTFAPGETASVGFICPVLPGRRVVGHRWDGVSTWAQYDLNEPNPAAGGVLQPAPALEFYRSLKVDELFAQAAAYWRARQERVRLQLPDARWSEAFAAMVGHSALCLNEGAPDVAVINYNVFNRDGVYLANIFQKSGNFDLAAAAIDYFLQHPFNGRVQPEADNPGQILWVLGEHWKFARDRAWLRRVYPATQKLAAMIRYYRTTPEPHWVSDTVLEFGNALPGRQRKQLQPGACDGFNPNYTEAYDIAGLRGAETLAKAMGNRKDSAAWRTLADQLLANYELRFGADLGKGYGSYSVLWPCRLYPFSEGRAHEQFKNIGAQKPTSWRYFPLARAHQGLLAGNREAGWETLNLHLEHPQMRGWYALDEGGPSGVGGWHHVQPFSSWRVHPKGPENQGSWAVAMPHGWAMAEFHLLLRDALAFEEGDRLVLLAGVPPAWFRHPAGLRVENLPTHFGRCSFAYAVQAGQATLTLSGDAPPEGWALCVPRELKITAKVGEKSLVRSPRGELVLGPDVRELTLRFAD